jgi:hypothetical protein
MTSCCGSAGLLLLPLLLLPLHCGARDEVVARGVLMLQRQCPLLQRHCPPLQQTEDGKLHMLIRIHYWSLVTLAYMSTVSLCSRFFGREYIIWGLARSERNMLLTIFVFCSGFVQATSARHGPANNACTPAYTVCECTSSGWKQLRFRGFATLGSNEH